ncbi:Trm112 family protein [Cyclobacterium roseum]|uniref:Trm112 family protein n=1 Tax=Cyclobacterium roseum TaxID=2666137 RepID=UPI00139102E7|nr:Trm112 family protein [Cyclobacterium roseum]
MKLATIEKLCCPFDRSDLELTRITEDLDGNIAEGWLHCTQCKRMYPIVKGIPIMNPDEYREFSLEQPLLERWQKQLKGKQVRNFRLLDKAQKESDTADNP